MFFQNIGISNKSHDSVSYTIHNKRKRLFFSIGWFFPKNNRLFPISYHIYIDVLCKKSKVDKKQNRRNFHRLTETLYGENRRIKRLGRFSVGATPDNRPRNASPCALKPPSDAQNSKGYRQLPARELPIAFFGKRMNAPDFVFGPVIGSDLQTHCEAPRQPPLY